MQEGPRDTCVILVAQSLNLVIPLILQLAFTPALALAKAPPVTV